MRVLCIGTRFQPPRLRGFDGVHTFCMNEALRGMGVDSDCASVLQVDAVKEHYDFAVVVGAGTVAAASKPEINTQLRKVADKLVMLDEWPHKTEPEGLFDLRLGFLAQYGAADSMCSDYGQHAVKLDEQSYVLYPTADRDRLTPAIDRYRPYVLLDHDSADKERKSIASHFIAALTELAPVLGVGVYCISSSGVEGTQQLTPLNDRRVQGPAVPVSWFDVLHYIRGSFLFLSTHHESLGQTVVEARVSGSDVIYGEGTLPSLYGRLDHLYDVPFPNPSTADITDVIEQSYRNLIRFGFNHTDDRVWSWDKTAREIVTILEDNV